MSSQQSGPIFVVGAPRTGTTLTMEILNLHSDVHLYNEVHYNERIVDKLGHAGTLQPADLARAVDLLLASSSWAGSTRDPEQDRAAFAARVDAKGISHAGVLAEFLATEAEAHGKTIWGDSSPQDVLYMGTLKEWYPAARFIGVIRDPRAYLASYKNYPQKQIASYRNRYNPVTNCLLWRSYMSALLAAGQSPLAPDLTYVKYEDLVTDPAGEIRRLCTFLGLEFSPGMLEVGRQNSSYFSVTEDVRHKGIDSGSLDRWRQELTRAEVWALEKICGRVMVELGYPREATRLDPGMLPGLGKIGLQLPGRMFNLLFRTRKPFTSGKVGRVARRLYRP